MAGAVRKEIYPLAIVLAAITIIEISITVLYPRLESTWERVPVLAIILLVPISIVSAFLYLWIQKPAHLYPPSEFGGTSEEALRMKLMAMCSPAEGLRLFGSRYFQDGAGQGRAESSDDQRGT